MRSVEYARAKGREARQQIGPASDGLLRRLEAHLRDRYGVALVPMRGVRMKGSRAEIDAVAMVLKYRASLGPEERLMMFAHELGHLVLHERLRDPGAALIPLLASAYADAGPMAIARYSPRTFEEAQATAFAMELVAPSDAVWRAWCDTADATSASLAADFGCSADVIQAQLAHALHACALGGAAPRASRAKVPHTAAQLAAACFTGAPALVDAGPGTGKTATILRRIHYLLEERGAPPSEMLLLTFSNEAARELSDRIARVFGDGIADAINVWTFHGFGMEFLHLHGHLAGVAERFELLDGDGQVEMVSALLESVACDEIMGERSAAETARRVVEHINYCKQRLIGADAFDDASQLGGVFREYEAEKRRGGRVDFADLIALPISVLEQNDRVRKEYAARFPWVIVDEFQDVTRATSRLLRALCGAGNPPWVVGDARQAIYQFLGAAPENVTSFREDFENARVFPLDVNFRSCEAVVSAANQLAALMEDPHATADAVRARWTACTDLASIGRVPVTIAEAASEAAEASVVADRVGEWIGSDGVPPGEIAVLCRRHADVRRVMLELSRRGIKAQASGLLTADGAAGDLAAMLARRECDDGFGALSAVLFDEGGYLRRILALADSAERQMALVEIVSVVSLATAHRAPGEARSASASRVGFAERLRTRLTRTTAVPLAPRPRVDAVHVMTCHASKGLEFPCVAVVGQTLPATADRLEWLPAAMRPERAREEAQANALLFVGVTRAKRAVAVSFARGGAVVPLLERWREVFDVPTSVNT